MAYTVAPMIGHDEPFADPGIPDGETTEYRGLIRDREVGTGRIVVEHTGDARRGGYRQRIDMTLEGELRYELEMDFARRRGQILPESYRLQTRHGDQPVAVEQGWFRGVKALRWGGELVGYPRGLSPLLACAVALRGLEFERGARRRFEVWLANTVGWDVETHVEKRERIDLPTGTAEAWRVRARPSFAEVAGALDRLIGALLPPFVLHFGAESPHPFLRFEFPTGPFRWNPRGVIEATSLG
jgi:hypothetical protein